MRRLIKPTTSIIVTSTYTYPRDKTLILNALDNEQEFYCAYTEECFTPGYARDVEHFDPTLKKTPGDGYSNWFSASTRFNRRKGSKDRWRKYQPIMHPTNADLESRLIYQNGHYILKDPNDIEAKNLRDFLFLNDMGLPDGRIAYIKNLKFLLQNFGNSKTELESFLKADKGSIKYRTAIKTELGINL